MWDHLDLLLSGTEWTTKLGGPSPPAPGLAFGPPLYWDDFELWFPPGDWWKWDGGDSSSSER